jgi:alcohol dehydrogenase class IV
MPARFDLATPADIRFGSGRVGEVPRAFADLGVTRVFVVTGSTPARAQPIRTALGGIGIADTVFPVPGEPSVDLLRQALTAVADHRCDAVLGYGGGSALDVAKAVAALGGSGEDPMEHLEVIGAGRPLTRPGMPCAAVPTTAGTGSEVTRNSVFSGDGVKASVRSPYVLPRLAVVDPDLLTGLPAPVIASGGMDALSQLVEPFLSQRANPLTDALARDGIRRSARSLRPAWQNGMADEGVREDLALASLFGGLCLANSGLGAVHGFAAAAGARLGAPHGEVCAALLAAATDVNLQALRARAPGHTALARMDEVAALLTGDTDAVAADGVAWLDELTRSLLIGGLGGYGLDESGVPDLVAAAKRASSMRANPLELTDAELTDILIRSL